MKNLVLTVFLTFFSVFTFAQTETTKTPDPWKPEELMAPADLAKLLTDKRPENMLIYNIGTASNIKYAIKLEPTEKADGVTVFKNALKNVARDKKIVIYCGCCKLGHCPNIRPAYNTLLEMGFKKPLVLNLPNELSEDWIEKGYPYEH